MVAATQSQAPSPPTRQPVSSGTIIGEPFTASTIALCTGTRAVEVDWAAWQMRPGGDVDPEAGEQAGRLREAQPEPVVQPGRPGLGARADLEEAAPRASEVCSAWRPWTRLPQRAAATDADVEPRGDRAHRGKIDLELLGGPLELEHLAAAVRTARRQRRVELPVDGPTGAMRWPWRPWARRCLPSRAWPAPLRVALGERGGLALARTTGLERSRSSSAMRASRSAEALRSASRARRCSAEPRAAWRSRRPTPCRSWLLRPRK